MREFDQPRAPNRPATSGETPGRPHFASLKLLLPFDLLAQLDGTGIAACFGLKNRHPENHTVVELTTQEARDLLALLKALETELDMRWQTWRKQASKCPIPVSRQSELEQRLQVVRRAAEMIGAEIRPPSVEKPGE